jgi:hypothetical protein
MAHDASLAPAAEQVVDLLALDRVVERLPLTTSPPPTTR